MKESKNLGERLPCPECRLLFTKVADVKDLVGGKVFIQNNCRFCKTPVTIEMGVKPYVKIYKTVRVLGIIVLILSNAYLIYSLKNLNLQVADLSDTINYAAK